MAKKGKAQVPKLSKEEQIEKLQAEIIADHRAKEIKRIEASKCSCKKSLNLKGEDYIELGKTIKHEEVECPNCKLINDVTVAYPNNGNPDVDDCVITIVQGGFRWEQAGVRVQDLDEEELKLWYENEMRKIEAGTSRLPFEIQVAYRMLKK